VSGERGGRAFAADPVIETPGELPAIWASQVVSCVVDENVGLPDEAVVTFRDPDHEFLTATGITIGDPLRVSVVTVAGQAREQLFSGEVTALEIDRDRTGSFTVVRAYSKAHRLQRGRRVVAFRNMTTEAIVRKVAAGAGLAVGKVDVKKPITYKHLSQANVSDWDFLQFLAGENGAQVRVDDKGLLQFTQAKKASGAPSPSTSAVRNPMVLEYGRNLISLSASLSTADGASAVEVRGWDVTNKKPLKSPKPSVVSETVLPGLAPSAASKFGKSKLTVTDTPYRTQAETNAVADAVADHVSSGFAELEVLAEGNPLLRAGKPVALGNVGPAFSGKYTATAVQHVLEPHGGYRTRVWVSTSPDRSITGLVTGANAPSRGPRMPGLAIGVVTDVRDAAGGERGSVRLKFPWLDDTYVSDWTRTVQWGGKGGGGVVSPEVNDEVLVGFEQGMLDSPYVIGGLYNGVDKPSEHDVPLIDSTTGKVNRRSVVSRSGHRIELLDARAPGPSGVRLRTADEQLEVFLDDRNNRIQLTVFARGRRQLTSVVLDRKGITLDAGRGNVSVSGQNVDIQGRVDVKIGGRNVTVDGTNVNVKGRTGVTIDGGLLGVLKAKIIRIN